MHLQIGLQSFAMGSIQKEVKECGRVLWKELQLSSWERQGCGHCFLSIFFLFPPLCLTKPFQFSSVAQPCPTLCDPINRSTPGLPVHHQLPEFTQSHVHWVGHAMHPSHPLLSLSPPAPNPSQHQSLFQWVNSAWGGQSIGVSASASVLPMNTQDWSPFRWTG